ncbi:hypothetical protein SLOPH_780 [Spraguea lophii 42_110]|uniref:RING-type domain-containing protein n=1 Tax=Spraguea lophii (strain 42_110) TaxID=1358809 RepID=S7W9D3_SPRLO|nr:hypothetical protein SLOPH_780 [Spraguea lophii 42_110]
MFGFILILPCILSSQFHYMVYRGFIHNDALRDDAPTDYAQHRQCVLQNTDQTSRFTSHIDRNLIKADEKIRVIENSESRALNLACLYIGALFEAKEFITTHITKALIPYIKETYLNQMYEKFIVLSEKVLENIEEMHSLEQYDLDIDYPIEENVTKITAHFNQPKLDFKVVLLYSFITLSKDAEMHRKIHLEKEEEVHHVEKNCALCKKNILPDDYVFSLLCRHQLHIECFKDEIYKKDVTKCFTCNENFWEKV